MTANHQTDLEFARPEGTRGRPMLPLQNSFSPAESQRRYQAIAADRKYVHFTRIPRRIIRCLDYFGVSCDSVVVERRLRAYYLFIGVIDNAIDSGELQVSQKVLRQFESRPTGFDQSTNISEIALVTERLINEISDESYPEVLNALYALSAAVEHERTVASMAEYIEARKQVGQLTAQLSFVVIRPLLSPESGQICHFMERVGEIGCLVDSIIDLHADRLAGLPKFQITARDVFRLVKYSVKNGVELSIEYPRLFGLFLEAAADTVLDRFRTHGSSQPQRVVRRTVTIEAAPTV